MHFASATITTRGDTSSSPGPTPAQRANTSFFTFLIALLLLVFASGALVLRAVLIRRRYRRRILQEAIEAGILLPNGPSINIQHKPELYEVCVRAAGDAMDWGALMPLCATDVEKSQDIQVDSKHKPNRSVRERLRELSGRPSVPAVVPVNDAMDDQPPTLQVAVLIAMPSEHPNIPSVYSALPQPLKEGEPQDFSMKVNDDAIPDLIFGISTFPVIPDEGDL